MNRSLPRRTFLRGIAGGAAIAMGLPLLEAMLGPHGDALADGRPIPRRLGTWFWGNGVRKSRWIPTSTGVGWGPSDELRPLVDAGLRDWVSPVTGLRMTTGTHPHHAGMAGIFTGMAHRETARVRDTIASTFAGPSFDQVVARRWAEAPETRSVLRSLEVGVCGFRGSDEGTTFEHVSHNGPNDPNPAEYHPRAVFDRLFGGGGTQPQLMTARASLLDAVAEDARQLRTRVGGADRLRLDQHLDSIRTLELRLGAPPPACARPSEVPPWTVPDDAEGHEQIAQKNALQSELLALALACDLTRVFTVTFSTCGAQTVYWMAGARDGLHQVTHVERNDGAEAQPTVHGAVTYTMERLATFLNALRAIPEGDGTLLDHCGILATSEHCEGYSHSYDEFPVLLCGRAGGGLVSGRHLRLEGENVNRAVLTLLRSVGVPLNGWGAGSGLVSEPIGELLSG